MSHRRAIKSAYFQEQERRESQRDAIPVEERCEDCGGMGANPDYIDAMDPGFWNPCGTCDETGRKPAAPVPETADKE